MNVANGSGMCLFGLFIGAKRVPTFDWLNAATGWHKTPEDYMEIGERIPDIETVIQLQAGRGSPIIQGQRQGAGRRPQLEGANRGRTMDIEKMIGDYWRQFGWDAETGKPTEARVAGLGIKDNRLTGEESHVL